LAQVQRRFDAYANGYRAQVERSLGSHELGTEQQDIIRRDLEALDSTQGEKSLAFSRRR
jgi:hypothetical protein